MRLKPCPFCGKTDSLVVWAEGDQYHVVCDAADCADGTSNGGCGASSGFADSIAEAAKAWNKRFNEEADDDV